MLSETINPTLSERLLAALQNERCIDLRYRELNPTLPAASALPNYKIMKQVALRRRLGRLYQPMVWLARIAMPAHSSIEWLLALVCSPLRAKASTDLAHTIPTTPSNVGLIHAALRSDPQLGSLRFDDDLLAVPNLAASIGTLGVLRCIGAHCALIWKILGRKRGERGDLLLHSRDAFVLIMLSHYADTHPEHWFVTECHYQRWSFLLSHSAARWALVQHGFLDSEIKFANKFGPLPLLFSRSDFFYAQFCRFYQIRNVTNFAPVTALEPNELGCNALFLASSFPAIDTEIKLARKLRARVNMPLIVKFHPSHAYDARKHELESLATQIYDGSTYPDCRAFISNNSFMEYDYEFLGKKTFAISRFESVDDAVEAIANWVATSTDGPSGEEKTSSAT